MTASDFLFEFHATFEGAENKAYYDSVGVLTIGIGHTDKQLAYFDKDSVWNEDQIRDAWDTDIKMAELTVNKWLDGHTVSQELYDALVDLAFNVGQYPRTMMAYIKEGDEDAAIHELLRWVYAGGEVLLGLVKRRVAMYVHCYGGDWREIAACPLSSKNLDEFNELLDQYDLRIERNPDTQYELVELD